MAQPLSSSFKTHVSYSFSFLNYLITLHNKTMTLVTWRPILKNTDELPNVQLVETATIQFLYNWTLKKTHICEFKAVPCFCIFCPIMSFFFLLNRHNMVIAVEPSGVQDLKNPNPLKDDEAFVVLGVAVLV